MKKIFLFIIGCQMALLGYAQYPPAAGQEGSTAIHKDDGSFVDWAVTCTVERGLVDISNSQSGYATYGSETNVIGEPGVNGLVSLGDGGTAVLTFSEPLANGVGWDFAVFENAFDDFFLELAFVEVSSDGMNYFRFPANSLTQTDVQVDGFGQLDPTKVNNLAGKYRVNYGTPFDLDDLNGQRGLDINHVTHVKIIDVVGCIQEEYAQLDSEGNIINDPWPTPFESSGFDLDAVGVINNVSNVGVTENNPAMNKLFFPNPVKDVVYMDAAIDKFEVYTVEGVFVLGAENNALGTFDLSQLPKGMYVVKLYQGKDYTIQKIMKF